MNNIIKEYESFSESYSEKNVWPEYRKRFHDFWANKIMDDNTATIEDFEMDPIIRMPDQNARGNTRGSIAVAKAFIRMGMWYRAFKSLKENIELKNKFDQILNSQNETELITLLNEFENINKEKKNCLTGEKYRYSG